MENIKEGDCVESIWIEIRDSDNRKIKIGGVFRPPEGCCIGGVKRTRVEIKLVE